jgi:hypothetical protein
MTCECELVTLALLRLGHDDVSVLSGFFGILMILSEREDNFLVTFSMTNFNFFLLLGILIFVCRPVT